MKELLEVARTSLCLFSLIYAAWSDYKTREVSNNVWVLAAPIAFALTFLELYLYNSSQLAIYGICFGLTVIFSLVLFYSGAFGGADAKALMFLALVLPFYPEILPTPRLSAGISPISQMLFPVTVFSNSVLLATATAVYIFFRNIIGHKKKSRRLFEGTLQNESLSRKILVLVTGYKIPIAKVKEKWHLYPLEDVEENEAGFKRKLVIIPRDQERDAIVERLTKAVETGKIEDQVWTTPGLPMLIFITIGLIVALLFGDVVWVCVRFLLG